MKRLSELTPEEKRGIFAEWLGDPTWDSDDMFDLNAIVKACERLEGLSRDEFAYNLKRILIHGTDLATFEVNDFDFVNATASQRVDALILTIGKATI